MGTPNARGKFYSGQRERGQNWQNFPDVFYGWPIDEFPPLLPLSVIFDSIFSQYYKTTMLSHPYSQALTLTPCSHVSLIFIFLITSSCYHITHHLISPSITQIPQLSPITCLTSYYSTRYHNTSQLTHHHINTMQGCKSRGEWGIHPPNNFDFNKKKAIKKILEEMSRKKWVFLLPNSKS